MKWPGWAVAVVSALLLAACSEEDTVSPNYEMQYVDVLTDASGRGTELLTDGGEHLPVLNPFDGLKADTVYRYVVYLVRQDEGVRIAAYGAVVSGVPASFEDMAVKTDSVKMQSIWRGADYINMTLQVLHRDKRHAYAFADRGITSDSSGRKMLHIQLYHDAGGDFPAFSYTCYLSCSLQPYVGRLQAGRDSVSLVVNEYKKGPTVYRLPF